MRSFSSVVVSCLPFLLTWAAAGGSDAPKPPSTGEDLLTITLEQKSGDRIQTMHAGHVFQTGDVVRFRLLTHTAGYLYVSDQSSSGRYSTLFPAAQTGTDNHVADDTSYLVPATEDGWFQVEGPPGYEVLYFLLSPAPLATPPAPGAVAPNPAAPLPPSLTPRCNDAIFRARGECIDSAAGPITLAPGVPLPPPLASAGAKAARDIFFTEEDGETRVKSKTPLAGPVIYTFRLAHR